LKKIRILFILNGLAIGGGELKVLELVRELKKKHRHRFHCVVCSVGQGGPLQDDFKKMDVPVHIFKKNFAYDVTQIFKLVKLIRDEKINIVQTTLFYADVIGTFAAWLAGIKNVISWEAVTQPYRLKHLLAYRWAAKWFYVSVGVSRAIQHQVIYKRHVHPRSTTTIQYGVDTAHFYPQKSRNLKKQIGINNGHLIVGTVARLSEQKGHCYLVEAASRVVREFPKVKFVLVGDGPLRYEIENQIDRFHLKDHFILLGFRKDVRELLNTFDMFVLPSLYEGLPNVVLEAMACAKPVVATAVDGTPEAVKNNETGYLVPSKDVTKLSEKILDLLNDATKRKKFGQQGLQRVWKYFNLEGQVEAFMKLYAELNASAR